MSGRGESSRSKSSSTGTTAASQSNRCLIPADLSFLFAVRPLSPNYEAQESQLDGTLWTPPTKRNAYTSGRETLFRWLGGAVRLANISLPSRPEVFSAASVFFSDETQHLLAVDFDAETRSVRDQAPGWRRLSFEYHRVNNSSRKTYSLVTTLGPEIRIAAPAPRHWIGQLLPRVYDYMYTLNDNEDQLKPATREQAGLIGSLPLLLALAAFSAPHSFLNQVLTGSVLPGAWQNHSFPSGHIGERGVVVTVYLDHTNPKGSTRNILRSLESGTTFGPFYGP